VSTDVSTSFPDSSYEEGTVVTVTMSDASSVITQIALHGYQEVPALPQDLSVIPPVLVHPKA